MLSRFHDLVTVSLLLSPAAPQQTKWTDIGNTQQPLLRSDPKAKEILHQLKRAEIIPTVLPPTFKPLVYLNATWATNTSSDHPPKPPYTPEETTNVTLGNIISPSILAKEPLGVGLFPFDYPGLSPLFPSSSTNGNDDNDNDAIARTHWPWNIILVLTDPDAPSRLDPKWSQVCHWLVHIYWAPRSESLAHDHERDSTIPIPLPLSSTDNDDNNNPNIDIKSKYQIKALMPYKPPAPPPKTGAHRYVLVALTAANRTKEKLNLTAPKGRQRWGFEEERAGLEEWAEEAGLEGFAANFFYAIDDEQ